MRHKRTFIAGKDGQPPSVIEWAVILDLADGKTRADACREHELAEHTVGAITERHRELLQRLRTSPRDLAEAMNDFTALELARGIRKITGEALSGDDTPAQSRTLATLTRAARDLATARGINATTDAKRPAKKQDHQAQQAQPTGALDALETA